MGTSEIFFIALPIGYVLWEMVWAKKELGKIVNLKRAVLILGCLLLSFALNRQLSSEMGGKLAWGEVFTYAYFLFSISIVVKLIGNGVLFLLNKIRNSIPISNFRNLTFKLIYYVLILILIAPFLLAMTNIHRPKISNLLNPLTRFGINYEAVTLHTKDRLNLSAWFIPANSKQVVIIAHGLGASKSNFLDVADMWHNLGFNVIIFDFRGHGDSQGHTVSFGYKERYDVLAALNYLIEEKHFSPHMIWGYGVSFGGAAMIHAINEDPRIRGLIIDSSFASLDHMVDKVIDGETIIPKFCRPLIKALGLFYMQIDLGFDIRQHSPQNVVGRLHNLPILFIHGKGDNLISWTESKLLYEKANEPKKFYLLNTYGHYGTINDGSYVNLIQSFVHANE